MAMTENPMPAEARFRDAFFRLLPQGHLQEAITEIRTALEQDPLNAIFRCYLSLALNYVRMHEHAIDEARKVLEVDERNWSAHTQLAMGYASQGRFAEALGWAENAYRLAPWHSTVGQSSQRYVCAVDTTGVQRKCWRSYRPLGFITTEWRTIMRCARTSMQPLTHMRRPWKSVRYLRPLVPPVHSFCPCAPAPAGQDWRE